MNDFQDEDLELPNWVIDLWFCDIEAFELDEEKCFYETEDNEEIVQLVYIWKKDAIIDFTISLWERLKNKEKYFYLWGNLESRFFPRGIFQKWAYNITLNGVGKYFIITLVKTA
jgi:hypothetical protein